MTESTAAESRMPALSAGLPEGPEEHVLLRASLLLLLFTEVGPATPLGLERLGYYDFFAANPFMVFGPADEAARADLHAVGFDERQLAYTSTGARFANRRKRLQHDVALLVAYGLSSPAGTGYFVTTRGQAAAGQFLSLYAAQYRTAVGMVHARFRRTTDTALAAEARRLLRQPSLLLDLYGSPDPADSGPVPPERQGHPG